MKGAPFAGKRILCIDENPEVLEFLSAQLTYHCGDCQIEKTSDLREAQDFMRCYSYDLIILEITGTKGFHLLELARIRNFPVALLASQDPTKEEIDRILRLNGKKRHAPYLLKGDREQLIPYLGQVMAGKVLPLWKIILERICFNF